MSNILFSPDLFVPERDGRIPLVDLAAGHREIAEELGEAIGRCLSASSYIMGPDHAEFSDDFASFCGGGGVALCSSGTDALTLALLTWLGKGNGEEEVITVAHTFIATAEAIVNAGYQVSFADVNRETGCLDADAFEAAITPRTKAVIPVHLYGQMAEMDRICEIANKYKLVVIEDAAQSHGARFMGKGPGHWGNAACFSFFPGKNLGALGDGGAIFSKDLDRIAYANRLLNHGRDTKYIHDIIGYNSRMDGLQAAILKVKLRYLEKWINCRQQHAARYDELLESKTKLIKITNHPNSSHVYHLYVILCDSRDQVLNRLADSGIGAGVHYPVPLHKQPACNAMIIPNYGLPNTEFLAGRVLSLPIYPQMRIDQQDRVVKTLEQILNDREES